MRALRVGAVGFVCSSLLLVASTGAPAYGSPSEARTLRGVVLLGIACPSATLCEAVGYTRGFKSSVEGVVVAIADGHPQPPQPVAGTSALSGIACPTATQCVAAAGDAIVTIDNGVPGAPQTLPPYQSDGDYNLLAVSCGAANACAAVGWARDGEIVHPAAVAVTDGLTGTPVVNETESSYYTAVACVSASHCDAVTNLGVGPIDAGVLGAVQPVADGTPRGIACETPTLCEITAQPEGGVPFVIELRKEALGTPVPVTIATDIGGIACQHFECVVAGRYAFSDDAGLFNVSHGTPSRGTVLPSTFDIGFTAIARVKNREYRTIGGSDDGGRYRSVVWRYVNPCPTYCGE